MAYPSSVPITGAIRAASNHKTFLEDWLTATKDTNTRLSAIETDPVFSTCHAGVYTAGTTPVQLTDSLGYLRWEAMRYRHTASLLASNGTPTPTGGCDPAQAMEIGTNKNPVWALPFVHTANKSAFWNFTLPDHFTGSEQFSVHFYWTAESGSGGVQWEIGGYAFNDDEALDQNVVSPEIRGATDTLITAEDCHICTLIAGFKMPLNGSQGPARFVTIKVTRNTASALDTMASTALLLGVGLVSGKF